REPNAVLAIITRSWGLTASLPFLAPFRTLTSRPPKSDRRTALCRNIKETMVTNRTMLLVAVFLMCQFSPTYLRPSTAEQAGLASIYSHESGSRTASGQKLNGGALTAAHRTLPLGSKVKITNKRNGRSVIVTINDRGPFVRGRVIDVTPAAARSLGFSGV